MTPDKQDAPLEIRTDGSRSAIISASRFCVQVLEAAGIARLFDPKVNGVDPEAPPERCADAVGDLSAVRVSSTKHQGR